MSKDKSDVIPGASNSTDLGQSPTKKAEDDEITSRFKGRSFSLTRSNSKKTFSPPKNNGRKKYPKTVPPSPRPKTSPKVNVRERRARFERVQEKYRTQRCVKDITREKSKI